MLAQTDRKATRRRVRRRVRAKISGSSSRPRVAVFRSLNHIYVQAIDDGSGKTLAQASTREPSLRGSYGGNVAAAKAVGGAIADRLKAAGVEAIVFDRGGFVYHGRVRALAEAMREAGIRF